MAARLSGWRMSVYVRNRAPRPGRTAVRAVIDLSVMTGDGSSSSESEPRVVKFPHGRAGARTPATVPPPVDDLAKFEHGGGADDYRHRMTVNIAVFVFAVSYTHLRAHETVLD